MTVILTPSRAAARGLAGLLGLAAGLALSAPALAADVPGGSGTEAGFKTGPAGVRGVFERRGDSDWYRLALKGGQNYAFAAPFFMDRFCATLTLRDLNGKVLRSVSSGFGAFRGFEFRPATTRTFLVEFKDCSESGARYPVEYSGGVRADARGDTTTAATIAVGQTVAGLSNSGDDRDYFRTRLERGKRYTIRVDGGEPYLKLVDARDKQLYTDATGGHAELAGVTVPATGTYYVVVYQFDEGRASYTLSLKTP